MLLSDWSSARSGSQSNIHVQRAIANENALVLSTNRSVCMQSENSFVLGFGTPHQLSEQYTRSTPASLVENYIPLPTHPTPPTPQSSDSPPPSYAHTLTTNICPQRGSYQMLGLFGFLELSLRLVLARRQLYSGLTTVHAMIYSQPQTPCVQSYSCPTTTCIATRSS